MCKEKYIIKYGRNCTLCTLLSDLINYLITVKRFKSRLPVINNKSLEISENFFYPDQDQEQDFSLKIKTIFCPPDE